MKNLGRTVIGLLALVACAGATSCKKGTYLEVVFKGAGLPPIHYIHFALTLENGMVSEGNLPQETPAGYVLNLPASAAFQLDDQSGALAITATAVDQTMVAIAQASTNTTIKHGETWTVTLDFAGGTGGDAAVDAPPDAGTGNDAPLVKITDGSIDGGGCVAATVQASETVSLDYNSSGSDPDSGNMLWAYLGPAENVIGWMKFGVKFVPKGAHLTKATLNLFMSTATGGVPSLVVDYSSVDGWTRKSKSSDVSNDGVISTGGPYLTPNAAPASTPYPLDVTNHNWGLDFTDGTITLGIANSSLTATALTSKIEFYGVNSAVTPDPTRPTLDLEFCP